MKKRHNFLTTHVFILGLIFSLLIGLPSSSLAIRDPNEVYRPVDPSAIPQSRPPVPLAPADRAEEDDDDAEDVSGDEVALPLRSGEVFATDKKAASFRAASGFDAFNLQHQNQWKATFSERTGRVKLLYGATSRSYAIGPEGGAREFLRSAHSLFGLRQDLSDLKTQRVDQTPRRRHVRFQQTHGGLPVLGAQVLVHSDHQGRVTMVQNGYLDTVAIANQDILALETARELARNDLRTSLKAGAVLSEPRVEKVLAPYRDRHHYVWKVSISTRDPWGLWVYHVDSGNGALLYKGDEIFYLTTGKGRAYINNDKWWDEAINNVLLKYMYKTGDGYGFEGGWLLGLHTDIWDNVGNDPFAADYKFYYYPELFPGEKPWFDATHAYYAKTTVWEWWNKNVIRKYGPWDPAYFYTLSIPTVVNVGEMCNAFYSSNITGGGFPGFAYGNEGSCDPGSEDLVIDNDVVRHEYAHAIMDWAGFGAQFGGSVNHYGRAMGEGNADWYAYLFSKKPEIADVAFPPFLRNLDNTRMYPYEVNHPFTGMPQEHYTGQIWGGYLYDLSRVLKRNALKYVYPSSFYFDNTDGHRPGFPDFVDALWAQATAELNEYNSLKQTQKAYGSMVSRGLVRAILPMYSHPSDYFGTGSSGSDTRDFIYWRFGPMTRFKTEGNILQSGDQHEYVIEATTYAGMTLTATVTGKSGGLYGPRIDLYTIGGVLLGSIDFFGNPSVTKATLTYVLPSTELYVIRVTGMAVAAARGHYTLNLSVK